MTPPLQPEPPQRSNKHVNYNISTSSSTNHRASAAAAALLIEVLRDQFITHTTTTKPRFEQIQIKEPAWEVVDPVASKDFV